MKLSSTGRESAEGRSHQVRPRARLCENRSQRPGLSRAGQGGCRVAGKCSRRLRGGQFCGVGEEETPARVYLFVDSVIIHSSCGDTKYLDTIAPAAECICANAHFIMLVAGWRYQRNPVC